MRNITHSTRGIALVSILMMATAGLALHTAPLRAQSLASRVQAAGANATVSFTYPTRQGVCGDGEGIIARRGTGDDFSIIQTEGNGDRTINISSKGKRNSRDEIMERCVDGPARVELSRNGGSFSRIGVTVGGSRSASLGTVSAQEAVAYLLAVAETAPHKVGTRALFAAYIADAPTEYVTSLIALTRRTSIDRDVRKDAVFWLSQTDDARAVPRLNEILRDRGEDIEVRKSSIFGLSQQEGDASVQTLIDAAKNLDRKELRQDAIFWLGQKAADRATEGLKSVLADDSEELEVRESALFALSQQKSDQAFDALVNVAKTSREPELRRTALFWLGQRGDDPRVLALFESILFKK
ncbi:MAG TPA: HEAT repeat domain-containing protein [Longimicrobiales bacterium]